MDSIPTFSSQKLCLTVDTELEGLSGHTEVVATISEGQTAIGLHAQDLEITSVKIEGIESGFHLRTPSLNSIPKNWKRKANVKEALGSVAHLAFAQYRHFLSCARQPNLMIDVPESVSKRAKKRKVNGCEQAAKSNEIRIEISFCSEKPVGLRFVDGYAYTQGGLHKASSWFPCIDLPEKFFKFNLEIAVQPSEMAVCSGELKGHSWSPNNKWKIFKYEIPSSIPASQIFVGVGQFDIVPCALETSTQQSPSPSPQHTSTTQINTTITHFAPCGSSKSLESTMKSYPFIFNIFKEILGAHFPLKYIQNIFLPDFWTKAWGWHSCCGFTTEMLTRDKPLVTNEVESQVEVARQVAKLWFGGVLMAKTSTDAWVVEGLAGWLEGRFIEKVLGMNEWQYRLAKQRQSVCRQDDGSGPPVCPRESPPEVVGTEWFDQLQLLRWKSASIMCMLERRVGHEAFRRVVERLINRAVHAVQSGSSSSARFVSTHAFIKEVGQSGGVKKEIQAFAERWVYGRGCPSLDATVKFDSKAFVVDLKIQQRGSEECREGTVKAMAMSEDGGIGVVKVVVDESVGSTEHTVRLGAESVKEEKFKTLTRPKKRRRADVEVIEDESQGPLKWVRVDPHGEWLADVHLDQSEVMWSNMLEDARDVVAEVQAIEGLASIRPSTHGIQNILQKYVESEAFCRARVEAAMALARTSCEENNYLAIPFLIHHFHDRCYDSETHLPKCNSFGNLGEFLVNRSIPFALAAARDEDGVTPPEALELVLEVLDYNDNEGNVFDDGDWVGTVLKALGVVEVKGKDDLVEVVKRIDRYLARDKLFPSPNGIITQACLKSLTALGLRQSVDYRAKLIDVLKEYTATTFTGGVRESAVKYLMGVEMSLDTADKAFANALEFIGKESSPAVQWGVLEHMQGMVPELESKVDGLSWDTVERIYNMFLLNKDMHIRHLAYLLLMALGEEPATTYRDKDENSFMLYSQDSKTTDSHDVENSLTGAPSSSQSPGSTKPGKKFKIKLKIGGLSRKA